MNALKTGRNDVCSCGSGKKYKQCCLKNEQNAKVPPRAINPALHQAIQAAWMHQQAGQVQQAEAICHRLLQAVPNQPDALHVLGVIALQDGNIEIAVQYFRKAIQGNPSNPQFYSNLGLALHEEGKLELAANHYRKALSIKPDYADAYYNLHALLVDAVNLQPSIECIEKAVRLNPNDLDARFILGMLLDYSGDDKSAEHHFELIRKDHNLYQARLDAWKYIKSSGSRLPTITGSNIQTFKLAIEAARINGLVLEFGVRHGNTIRQIAGLVNQEVHGFDSFEGLPEVWHHEPKGSYTTKGVIPTVPGNVKLHVGWFENTLPVFLQQNGGPVRLMNIDCDIYSSTKTVLELLAPRIVVGTTIIFDEYIGNEHWREDEFKAFQEAVAVNGWSYEYLCFSIFTKQVAIRITRV